jgi:hypothetical protein
LTRTFQLDQKATLLKEDNAQVSVEGKDNSVRPLTGSGNGYYVSPDLQLVINNEYRLRIKTIDGKEYLSDYIRARTSPAIDSISYDMDENGVVIFANTHDASNATRYYRWDYDETWEFRSVYYSNVIYDKVTKQVRPRNLPSEDVSVCWKYDTSGAILLSNSTRLERDIISRFPLLEITAADERLYTRYSIQVRQYALEKEAYEFYEQMKRNTQDIGSLFSPQPFELRGNIHCVTNPEEYVLGYLTASTVEKQRIFIRYPSRVVRPCTATEVTMDSVDIYFGLWDYMPFEADYLSVPPVFNSSVAGCVDCRLSGGTTQKPSFW